MGQLGSILFDEQLQNLKVVRGTSGDIFEIRRHLKEMRTTLDKIGRLNFDRFLFQKERELNTEHGLRAAYGELREMDIAQLKELFSSADYTPAK